MYEGLGGIDNVHVERFRGLTARKIHSSSLYKYIDNDQNAFQRYNSLSAPSLLRVDLI